MEEDKSQFLSFMKQHVEEVDFALAIFAAAASSYKCESLVKPFPPMFVSDCGSKNIADLVSINFT